jgi:hypothetical protein
MAEQGVYVAIIIAETVLSLTAFYFFKKGLWKNKLV